jgi:hypothetical protein
MYLSFLIQSNNLSCTKFRMDKALTVYAAIGLCTMYLRWLAADTIRVPPGDQ